MSCHSNIVRRYTAAREVRPSTWSSTCTRTSDVGSTHIHIHNVRLAAMCAEKSQLCGTLARLEDAGSGSHLKRPEMHGVGKMFQKTMV